MARVFTSRLNGSASMQVKTIFQLMRDIDRIVLNASYQRDFVWTKGQTSDLIDTVMHGGIIPPCTLYQFQHGDVRPDGMMYECIDGQHRLKSLKHFLSGTWIVQSGRHDFMVTLPFTEANGTVTILFYSETPDTIEWSKQHPTQTVKYFTEDERDLFRAYVIDMKIINATQSEKQRRELFVSLSKGTPLRGCDVKQNHHNIPLIAKINEMHWKSLMRDMIREKCYIKADKFWVHWIVRMFLLSKTPDAATCAISDSSINEYIKRDVPTDKLNYTEEEMERFVATMERFFRFNLPSKVSPTGIFALFVQLIQANDERVLALEAIASEWTEVKEKHKFWNKGTTAEQREEYFKKLNDDLASI